MKEKNQSNYTGTRLEKFIEDRLIEKEYQYVPRDKFKVATYLNQPIYSRQFHIGSSIYGTPMYCDFVLFHPEKWVNCLIIESKWQQSGGSVDEKFPYFVLNIQQKHPHQVIVLLDGGGYKQSAEIWLRGQVGNNLLKVFNMGEFQKWANQGNI